MGKHFEKRCTRNGKTMKLKWSILKEKRGEYEKMGRENNTVISEDYRKTGSSKKGENGSSGQGNWVSRFSK